MLRRRYFTDCSEESSGILDPPTPESHSWSVGRGPRGDRAVDNVDNFSLAEHLSGAVGIFYQRRLQALRSQRTRSSTG